MPDESCRSCGGILHTFLHCFDCKKPTQLICGLCKKFTEKQYHSNCDLIQVAVA